MPDPTETPRRKRVFFPPGDALGWALDEDLRLLRASLDKTAIPSSLARAEIVHTVFWPHLLHLPPALLARRRVLSYADNPPFHYLTSADFIRARRRVDLWIGRSRQAVAQFERLGLPARFAPYTVDTSTFHPVAPGDPALEEMRARWSIPTDRYVIANFHRDTEGHDLRSPKLQKGPDLFAEIVERLAREGHPIHVLLAGPRRFYLRRRLAESGVPHTFAGTGGLDAGDDMRANILPRRDLNLLYQLADLTLVTSRWEGGPHSILEAAATRTAIMSTRVGIAPDVLEPACLYDHVAEAVEKIAADIATRSLASTRELQYQRTLEHHTEPALRQHLEAIYHELETQPPTLLTSLRDTFAPREKSPVAHTVTILGDASALRPSLDILRQRGIAVTPDAPATIALVPETAPPPAVLVHPTLASCLTGDTDHACIIPRVAPSHPLPTSPVSPRILRAGFSSGASDPSEAFDILVLGKSPPDLPALISRALALRAPVLFPVELPLHETVWFGGLAYSDESEIPEKLAILTRDLATFRRLIVSTPPWELADRLRQAANASLELRQP